MLAQPVSAAINAVKHNRRQVFKMGMVDLFIFVFPLLMLVFLKFIVYLLLTSHSQGRIVLLLTKALAFLLPVVDVNDQAAHGLQPLQSLLWRDIASAQSDERCETP
jgi:hypothetical protein